MAYDKTFPEYATRVIRVTGVLAAIATVVCYILWDWEEAVGAAGGAAFQILFMMFLRWKYVRWSEAGKEPDAIDVRLVGFTGARLFFEIAFCILVAIFLETAVVGFLIGLLSLTVASVVDKIISVIKE